MSSILDGKSGRRNGGVCYSDAVKSLASDDVSIAYVREKCLAAFELAFDKGNEKAAHFAVEGVQVLPSRHCCMSQTSSPFPNISSSTPHGSKVSLMDR